MAEQTTEGTSPDVAKIIAEDVKTLHGMGYAQELHRRMHGFSNFAISFSIICILAGGITSFPVGLNSVGGAAIGLGWPLSGFFSLIVALGMGQIASAFPTAGGLYHWGSILGGRGFGWLTAWFNLIGLITVMAAVNVGTYNLFVGFFGPVLGFDPSGSPADVAGDHRLAHHHQPGAVQSPGHPDHHKAHRRQRLHHLRLRDPAHPRAVRLCAEP